MLHLPAARATPLSLPSSTRCAAKVYFYQRVPEIRPLCSYHSSHVLTSRFSRASDATTLSASRKQSYTQSRKLGGSSSWETIRKFSSSPITMVASKIDGVAIAKRIREGLKTEIEQIQESNPIFVPSLVIFQVCNVVNFPESVTQLEIIQEITKANNDSSVHGILVQLPLPEHISEHAVTSIVADGKDVDGFGANSIGELAKRKGRPLFIPCTPQGVMELLRVSGVDPAGKEAVVLGRSDIVGSPVSYFLKNADATFTVCHSKTSNVQRILGSADIAIAAIGKAQFVKGEWLKPGAVVIDVGTNYIPDSTKKSGQRLVGDVDFESASQVASQITPVPGGVGPMTIAMLLRNVVNSAKAYFDKQKKP